MVNKAYKDYIDVVIKGTQYSGNTEPGKCQLSASQVGSDILPLWLEFKYGKQQNQNKIEANTLGSILHRGLEKLFKEHSILLEYPDSEQYRIEEPIQKEFTHKDLKHRWTITGTLDLIDLKNKVIIDHKLSTGTTLKSIYKEGKDHHYAMQLGIYKWLLGDKDYKCALAFFNKSQSYFKVKKEDLFTMVELEVPGFEEIEKLLLNKLKELEVYINEDALELGSTPPKCKNTFPYKMQGKVYNMKCLHYCDFKDKCTYFSSYQAEQEAITKFDF